MKRFVLGLAAVAAVSACSGGNPFVEDTGGGGEEGAIVVPENIAGDLTSFTYDPVAKTLVVKGVSLDDTPFEAVYARKPALDVPGYEAYTNQESSLTRHTTAYVQQIDGAHAAITVSGGQFGHYFGGSSYGRDGAYDPPSSAVAGGVVSYAGNYVGLMNAAGDGGDLLPVDPSTPDSVRPKQAAEVTGKILISADFADNMVEGLVYDRVVADAALSIEDLELAGTAIEDNGSFTGEVTQEAGKNTVGAFGGVFGGPDASAVAGTLFVENHVTGRDNLQEYGLFVLSQCGTAGADPLCSQPNP